MIGLMQSLSIIFLIILLGVFSERRKIFNATQIEGFEIFLFKIVMPCYLFTVTLHHDLSEHKQVTFILSYLLTFLLVAMVVFSYFYKKNSLSEIGIKVLMSSYINSAIYALPIITFLLGNPIAGVVATLVQILLIQVIFLMFLSFLNHREKTMLEKLRSSVGTPLVVMPVVGLLCDYLNISPPSIIVSVISNVGGGASSLALFTFGLMLGGIKINKSDLNRKLLFIVFAKNIFHPIAAFFVGKYLFDLENYWLTSLVIIASAPTGFFVYFIAKQFSSDPHLGKRVVAISSLFSLISLIFISVSLIG